jgi:hypothetical protein
MQLLCASAALAGMAGCASQGALQPPSLHLPAHVEHLSAERFGDAVDLHWTTPSRTTDGVALQTKRRFAGPYTAEICRSADPFPPGPCSPLSKVPVESGRPATFHDVLTPPWTDGSPRVLRYRVSVVNAKGRGVDGVDIAVMAGSSVPPITGLRAAPIAGGGVALRWLPAQGHGDDRVLLHVLRGGTSRPETLAVEPTAKDPGGANDSGARPGVEQAYTVYRTRTLTLEKQQLTLSSAPATVTVAAGALAPLPSAPTGLEAVVNTLGAPEIDLVWQAGDEPGVAGYIVSRAEGGAAFVPMTPAPIHAFSFSDTAVRPGGRYRYRVAAVNDSGAPGLPSAEIERAVPAP